MTNIVKKQKFTAIKSFFLHGEVVSPGDTIMLTEGETSMCHRKIRPFVEKPAAEVKAATPRKVSTRKAAE